VFNLSGSEIVVILLLALIVLGPEKLPEAIRRFGRIYGELRKMGTGFQSEFRTAFEEPLKELRETAQLTRDAVMNPINEEMRAAETDQEQQTKANPAEEPSQGQSVDHSDDQSDDQSDDISDEQGPAAT
jgi:sec-independent protein translocase protein TatB